MPLQSIKIGPFAGIYVGDYGDTDVLSQIFEVSTGPMTLNDNIPEQYEDVVDNSVQSGRRKVSFNISFYGDDEQIINLARGLSIKGTDKSAGSEFAQYTLLLVYGDDTAKSSVLLPKCYTIKNMDVNYDKNNPTKIDIQFVAINRNRFAEIYYMDTVDALATILGSRSPV